MKTREEIEKEYAADCKVVWETYGCKLRTVEQEELAALKAARAKRDAALAELDDPLARLIAAGKEHMNCRECGPLCISCQKALRDAIDYAEQRRAQG